MNPAHWLERSAVRAPGAPALFSGTRLVARYEEFNSSAAHLAAGLASIGVARGERVAIYMENCTDYLIALYGIWRLGAVAVPINAKLHPAEAAFILEDCNATLVICNTAPVFEPPAHVVVTGTDQWRDLLTADDPRPIAQMDPDDLAWLFYTSGTTGKPKGVMITCGNLASMSFNYFTDVDDVYSTDAALYAAPMSHGAGIYNFMHVLRGARHIVPESGGFDPVEILELAPEMGPISMFAAPTMVRRLVDVAARTGSRGEGLRTITYAGGPMYEVDITAAVTQMGPRFIQVYGQGECPMGITALPRERVADRVHPRWRERLNSVGLAQSSVLVRIFDENGQECPTDEIGEIVVRGATVMKGYWNNPEATAGTIRDGWLWTGDMGRMDADGFVTMQDRSKDLIISGGSNIYPREVEEVLLQHADVQEVAVVGRADAEWGEVVIAFVVGQASAQELDALCLSCIARFKRPKEYVFVDALPKNNYGKVLKTELRARLQAG